MTNILLVTSSPRGDDSLSQSAAGATLHDLMNAHPQAKVVVRDLAHDPDGDPLASGGPDALIDEVLAADILVIAVPMIRFSMPPALKAWIDHVTQRGRTFGYQDGRPKGLLNGRRAIIVQPADELSRHYEAPYLHRMLKFLGIGDIEVVHEATSAGAEPALPAGEDSGRLRIVSPAALGPDFPISHRSTGEAAPRSLMHADAGGRHAPPHPHWTPLGASVGRSKTLRTHWPHGGMS